MTHLALTFELESVAETERLAQDLGFALSAGDMVFFNGPLGAGKSTFVRALLRAQAASADLEVPSPTFTLIQDYELGNFNALHVDLFRLEDPDEVVELGLSDARPDNVLLVEWGARADGLLGHADVQVDIETTGIESRRITIAAEGDCVARLDRSLAIRRALTAVGWGAATRVYAAADGSARRYERLIDDNRLAIVMDYRAFSQEPAATRAYRQCAHLSESMEDFFAIGEALQQRGLRVPATIARRDQDHVALLEDLGQTGILTGGHPVPERYLTSVEALARLHQQPPPGKEVNHAFDWAVFHTELSIFPQWYLPDQTGTAVSDSAMADLTDIGRALFEQLQQAEQGWLIRDVHSPNILWQADAAGTRRAAFIDYQDALRGPTAYDVVSLCLDVRTTVPAAFERQILTAYLDARSQASSGFDDAQFNQAYRICGTQRLLKILGIFVRLHIRDNKPEYRRYLPGIVHYLGRLLVGPESAALRDWLRAHAGPLMTEIDAQ